MAKVKTYTENIILQRLSALQTPVWPEQLLRRWSKTVKLRADPARKQSMIGPGPMLTQ
jgi:hypothetical protein